MTGTYTIDTGIVSTDAYIRSYIDLLASKTINPVETITNNAKLFIVHYASDGCGIISEDLWYRALRGGVTTPKLLVHVTLNIQRHDSRMHACT